MLFNFTASRIPNKDIRTRNDCSAIETEETRTSFDSRRKGFVGCLLRGVATMLDSSVSNINRREAGSDSKGVMDRSVKNHSSLLCVGRIFISAVELR